MTQRQEFWKEAADRAASEHNELAWAIFTLIAQPNDQERKHPPLRKNLTAEGSSKHNQAHQGGEAK